MNMVRPLTDLKDNLNEIALTAHETRRPIILTENGYGNLVILSMKAYEDLCRDKTAEEKYDEYFTPQTVNSILRSIEQAERGEVITFTVAELEAMEDGEVPQRAIDFLEAHKKSGNTKS